MVSEHSRLQIQEKSYKKTYAQKKKVWKEFQEKKKKPEKMQR